MIVVEPTHLCELERGLTSDDYSLETVLAHPAVFAAVRTNNETVVNFLADNVKTILECSFRNISSPESTSAFQSLLIMNERITRALITSNDFHQMALDILAKDLDSSIVGRLSELTALIIRSSQPGSIDCCNFLLKMLKFAEHIGILNLFVTVLDDSIEFQLVQQWLLNHDFAGHVLQELEAIPVGADLSDDPSDCQACRFVTLFLIIEAGSKNRIVSRSFRTSKIVKFLFREVSLPWIVEDARWRAILAICDDAGRNICSDGMDYAARVLLDTTSCIHQYHEYIIEFLARMLPESYDPRLIERMMSLLVTHRENSILHRSIVKFVKISLRNKCMDPAEICSFVTFLCEQTAVERCGNLHASSMELIELFMTYWKKHKRIQKELYKSVEGLRDIVRNRFLPYFKLRDTDYGRKEGILKRIFKIGSRDSLQTLASEKNMSDK